jgi:hypothetical protein
MGSGAKVKMTAGLITGGGWMGWMLEAWER